jgi:tripartite-type tricarboxylate transporter receptor subunit TctC
MLHQPKNKSWIAIMAALLLAGLAVGAGPVSAAGPVTFAGKTVNVIVPYTEGGGTDLYARIFVPFLKKHLPGQPTVIIRNMPGGGSILGSNRFEATAKPDGLTIVATSSSTLVAQLLAGKKREFDVLKWRQLIVSPLGTVVYFSTKTSVAGKDIAADIERLKGQKLRYGAKQPDAGELRTIFSFEVLGLNVETIFGLARGEARQAILRGEMEVSHDTSDTYQASVESLAKQGEVIPLYTLGYPKGAEILRDPEFPNLPTVGEIYKTLNGRDPSGPTWQAYTSFVNLGVAASKGFALPKGTPNEIRDAYLDALKKTIDDPEFKKLSGDEVGAYPQLLGDDADFAIKQAVDLPPDVDAWMRNFLATRYGFKS